MSTKLRALILALAMSGLAAGAWAQAAPDAMPPGAGADAAGGPPHAWHDEQSQHWHHHHHHHRHHHHCGRGRGEHAWGGHGWGGHDGGDGWGGAQAWHRSGPDKMGGAGLLRSFRALNLSAAQQQQVHGILSNAHEQIATQRAGGAPDMVALANPGDPNHAAAIQAAKKRAADRIERASELQMQLYNVLTPAQKSELSKRMADWKSHMAQRAEDTKRPPAPANR